MTPLAIVVAISRNDVIGKDGKLPWHVPEDLKHFKDLTLGHAIIMGRATFEEVGKPLPKRRNIVVTSRGPIPGCDVATSVEDAIRLARETDREPRVIGGAGIFRAALPYVTTIHLTEIDRDVDGDTRFHLDRTGFREVERRRGESPDVWFVTLEREAR